MAFERPPALMGHERRGAATCGADSPTAADKLIAALCAPRDAPLPVPHTVVVVAHPDDEVIGAGSRLPRLNQSFLVHVTDGAPRDGRDAAANGFSDVAAYAAARRAELEAALALCGIRPEQTHCLGCVDQNASPRLVDLARQLATLFIRRTPEAVLTHPYEGGHPDHDATAFAVHAAAALVRRHGHPNGHPAPAVVEMTSYHNSPSGICPGEFLPHQGFEIATVILTPQERRFKRQLFDCFTTQQGTLRYFPIGVERFRPAPAYDFTAPPHPGSLFYEGFDWGMTGARFRALASDAMKALNLEGPL